jgi:hypothetical protein
MKKSWCNDVRIARYRYHNLMEMGRYGDIFRNQKYSDMIVAGKSTEITKNKKTKPPYTSIPLYRYS